MCLHVFRLTLLSCMPPPVSSAVILTKAVGGNEVRVPTRSEISLCSIYLLGFFPTLYGIL